MSTHRLQSGRYAIYSGFAGELQPNLHLSLNSFLHANLAKLIAGHIIHYCQPVDHIYKKLQADLRKHLTAKMHVCLDVYNDQTGMHIQSPSLG
jgi:hypothetical protein